MDDYLVRYCKYLLKLTTTVSITDTLTFIDNDDFEIDEIIEKFKNIINIHKICSLVNKDNFLVEFEYHDKIEVFLEFFINLHNYAKNLIKKFDIYSKKVITESSLVMRGNIMLFPHHRRYMEKLLGYEYDSIKKEWEMKSDLTKDKRIRLAAVCILVAFGHRQIEDIKTENKSIDDDRDSHLSEEVNGTMSSPDQWTCKYCTSVNDAGNSKCSACDNVYVKLTDICQRSQANNMEDDETRNVWSNDEENENPTININPVVVVDCRKRNIEEKWSCSYCDQVNDFGAEICEVCSSERPSKEESEVFRALSPSNLLQRRLKEWNPSIEENNDLINMMPLNSLNIRRKPNHTQWQCKGCENINDLKVSRCESCFKSRSEGRLKGNDQENNQENERKSLEQLWKCEKCTFRNDIKLANCNVCFQGRLDKDLSQRQWTCVKCTFINDITDKTCIVCSKSRHLVENDTNRTPNKDKLTEELHKSPTKLINNDKKDERNIQHETNYIKDNKTWVCTNCNQHDIHPNVSCSKCKDPKSILTKSNKNENNRKSYDNQKITQTQNKSPPSRVTGPGHIKKVSSVPKGPHNNKSPKMSFQKLLCFCGSK